MGFSLVYQDMENKLLSHDFLYRKNNKNTIGFYHIDTFTNWQLIDVCIYILICTNLLLISLKRLKFNK